MLSQSTLVIIENATRALSGLLITILYAKVLGASDWGLLSFAIFIAGLGTHLGTLGIDQKIISKIYNSKSNAEQSLLTASVLIFFATLLVTFVFAVASTLLNYFSEIRIYVIILVSLSSFQFVQQFDHYFYSRGEPLKVFINKMIYNILNTLIKIICIHLNVDFLIIVMVFAIENLLYALIVLSSLKTAKFRITYQQVIEFFYQNINLALILLFGSLLSFIAYRIDIFFLKHFTSLEQVGIYALFIKIISCWIFVTSALSNYLVPDIKDFIDTKNKKILLRMLSLIIILSLLFIITSHIAVGLFIHHLSEDFMKMQDILQISFIAVPLIFLNTIFNRFLLLRNLDKYLLYKSIILLLMTAVSGYFLVSKLGIFGAGINFVLFFVYAAVINTQILLILQKMPGDHKVSGNH